MRIHNETRYFDTCKINDIRIMSIDMFLRNKISQKNLGNKKGSCYSYVEDTTTGDPDEYTYKS